MFKTVSSRALAVALLSVTLAPPAAVAQDPGRMYGRVTTLDGDVFEGFIRWDKNEASWSDVLNGSKELRYLWEDFDERDRRSVRVMGLRIDWERDGDWPTAASSGIRMGHLRRLEVVSDNEAILTLKSGAEIEFRSGSTDIGNAVREILIEDVDEGRIQIEWEDLDAIEFMETPARAGSRLGQRLHGTVATRDGKEFTGYVAWDMDETLTSDVLDGEEGRRDRDIDFSQVESIERASSRSALVRLKTGSEIELSGTNDVNDSNRGIVVSDPRLGTVQVGWSDFRSFVLSDPPRSGGYGEFDGGRLISGTVYTADGETFRGTIRWDNDEEYTWELLNGEDRTAKYEIEFGLIAKIERASTRSALVMLRDGRTFEIRGSNDVDRDNKGIFVTSADGTVVTIDWYDFERVEFDRN